MSLVVKQAICFILLINNYEMVKVTVGLKQFFVSVFGSRQMLDYTWTGLDWTGLD